MENLTSEDAKEQWRQLSIQVHRANNRSVAEKLNVPLEYLTVENLRKDKRVLLYQAIVGSLM